MLTADTANIMNSMKPKPTFHLKKHCLAFLLILRSVVGWKPGLPMIVNMSLSVVGPKKNSKLAVDGVTNADAGLGMGAILMETVPLAIFRFANLELVFVSNAADPALAQIKSGFSEAIMFGD